nr:MAG TPA: hypothetical protein [Caudoviricetes sp.]
MLQQFVCLIVRVNSSLCKSIIVKVQYFKLKH